MVAIIFVIMASNRPDDNFFITQKELKHIQKQLENEGLKGSSF